VRIPAGLLKPFGPLLGIVGGIVTLPNLFSEDGVNILDVSYAARSDKARDELGWRTRSLQEGMSETFRWIAGTVPSEPQIGERNQRLAGLALLSAALLFIAWFYSRIRD
jgi:hypothetical protein